MRAKHHHETVYTINVLSPSHSWLCGNKIVRGFCWLNTAATVTKHLQNRWMVVLLVSAIQVSEEVSVTHFHQPIKASAGPVILPCEFYTDTYETPQITWYQEKGEERRKIMQYDIHNRLTSYGEFVNRVARGDRGALVLLKTYPRDSGNYSCEIEVDNEIPSWVKSTVVLEVAMESSDHPLLLGIIGRFVLLSIFWFVPVICGALLGRSQLNPSTNSWSKMRRTRNKVRMRNVLILVSLLALGLVFTAVIFMEIAVRNTNNAEIYNYHLVVSLITGSTGTVILVVLTILWPCLPKNCCCKRKYTANDAISYTTTPEAGGSNVKFFRKTEMSSENKTISASNIRTLKNPQGNRVTGMVWLSKDFIGVTTSSGLFKINVENSNMDYETKLTVDSKCELLSVGNYRSSLIMCARKNDDKEKRKGYLLKMSADKSTSEIFLKMSASPTILHFQESRADGSVYAALSNPNQVVVKDLEKVREKTIWQAVLSKPECIVQNSRGQFIVADCGKSDIFVFEEDEEFLTTMKVSVPRSYAAKLNGSNRLAVGPDDRIFASSPWSSDIFVFSEDFRFEGILANDMPSCGVISCLLVHNSSLYVCL